MYIKTIVKFYAKWLKLQQFNFSKMSSSKVVNLLTSNALAQGQGFAPACTRMRRHKASSHALAIALPHPRHPAPLWSRNPTSPYSSSLSSLPDRTTTVTAQHPCHPTRSLFRWLVPSPFRTIAAPRRCQRVTSVRPTGCTWPQESAAPALVLPRASWLAGSCCRLSLSLWSNNFNNHE